MFVLAIFSCCLIFVAEHVDNLKQVEMHYRIRYYCPRGRLHWIGKTMLTGILVNFRRRGAACKDRAYLQARLELPSALIHRCFGRYGRRLRSSGIRKITMQLSNLHLFTRGRDKYFNDNFPDLATSS